MSFLIDKAGPLSLIQDYGRIGMQGRGIGVGGPADEHAYAWANHLLGNHFNCPVVEITLGAFRLTATADVQLALTGAEMSARLNDNAIDNWSSHFIRAGDVLKLSVARRGLRAYLAVKGGFQSPMVFASCSTVTREKLGGLTGKGEILKVGNELGFTPSSKEPVRQLPVSFVPDYDAPLILPVLPSAQYAQFNCAEREAFFSASYRVSANSNRMAYQLEGAVLTPPEHSLVSEGISLGAIQLPPSGQPIVLLQDRQTIGGYPKIGCIPALDASRLAQRRPGCEIRFCLGDLEKAVLERERFNRFFGIRVMRKPSRAAS